MVIPKNAVPKYENEWMWQFWLIFGEFLDINGYFSQKFLDLAKIHQISAKTATFIHVCISLEWPSDFA